MSDGNSRELLVEDDEMKAFTKSALTAVTFKIIYGENDLEAEADRVSRFQPEMAHQIFGDNEMIFGYKNLRITLNYLHNSAKCFVEIDYSDKIGVKAKSRKTTTPEPDNLTELLNDWLPCNYRLEKLKFLEDIKAENHAKVYGEILSTFAANNSCYKVTKCDVNDSEFRQFHERFETYMIWFIDGANFIDLDDVNWMLFYVYEEKIDEATQRTYTTPIGFCTVYKFYHYPNLTRTRISQFLVLPTHQRLGIGTKFYSTIFEHLSKLPNVADITVEEPTEVFRKVRDFADLLLIYEKFKKDSININVNQKKLFEILKTCKICRKQARKVLDMLECFRAKNTGAVDYLKFKEKLKKRIEDEMTKELRGSKRICNMERAGVAVETENLKERVNDEFNRYIDSFEGPLNRLKNYLNQ